MHGSPGSWQAKVVVPAARIVPDGVTVVPFVAPEVVGGAVRAVATVRGNRVESAPVFVTNVERCRPRTDHVAGPRLTEAGPVEETFAESELARRFNRELLRLLDHTARHHTARHRTAAARSGGSPTEVRAAVDRWQQFLDRVERSIGPSLMALVYPGARTPAAAVSEARWVIGDVPDESELAEDETDAVLDDAELFPDQKPRRTIEHSTQCSWLSKWVGAVRRPRDSAASRSSLDRRMLVAALAVNRLAAGIWDGSEAWRAQLADVVEALVPDPFDIAEGSHLQQGYLESWIAVCLALLLQDASLHGGTEADIAAQRAWTAGRELAADADPILIKGMIEEPGEPHARVTTETGVLAVVELAVLERADPLATVLAGLAEDGLEIERRGGAWIVRGGFRQPAGTAARALTELGGVVVVATNGAASTIMIHRDGEVLVAETLVRTWRSFRIRPPMTPASIFRADDSRPRAERPRPLYPVPNDVLGAGRDANVDIAALVQEFLPPPTLRPPQWSDAW